MMDIQLNKSAMLCSRCQRIDFGALLQKELDLSPPHYSDEFKEFGELLLDLESSPIDLLSSACALCRLFGAVSPSDTCKDGSSRAGNCYLRVFSAAKAITLLNPSDLRELEMRDRLLLGVVRFSPVITQAPRVAEVVRMKESLQETGLLFFRRSEQPFQGRSPLDVRRIKQDVVDYAFIHECLKYCRRNHAKHCGRPRRKHAPPFRVIECRTLAVLEVPPACEYVALSYLWGELDPSNPPYLAICRGWLDLQRVPKVISDSIHFTLECGLRYLWVDRYCINQSDEQDKYDQIRQMDLIYANAQFTIIAVAGSGPHHGLPGVKETKRKPQPTLALDGISLVSTLPFARWLVGMSTWATRGWTYQEGLLSSRRVIFTDEQVYFECNEIHCAESIVHPWDHVQTWYFRHSFQGIAPSAFSHHEYKSRVSSTIYMGGSYLRKTIGHDFEDIMTFVSEFSQRKLSFAVDRVNAMQGIFQRFSDDEYHKHPFHFFVGIPIIPPIGSNPSFPAGRTATEGFLMGLCWRLDAPGRRRKEFPSWSWAGWKGQVKSELLFNLKMYNRFSHIDVWVEDEDKALVPFPDWDQVLHTLSRFRDRCRFIHIEAHTFPVQVDYIGQEDIPKGRNSYQRPGGYFAKICNNSDSFSHERVHFDFDVSEEDICYRRLTGILISESSGSQNLIVLVVEEMDGWAERRGIFSYNTDFLYEGMPWRADRLDWVYAPKERRRIRLG